MSYSFTKRAATRKALAALVVAELDVIVKQQPIHERDANLILANFANASSLVAPDHGRPYSGHMLQASLNGSVSWRSRKHEGLEEPEIVGVNISCSVAWVQMTQAELADEAATRVSDPSVYGSGEGANPQVPEYKTPAEREAAYDADQRAKGFNNEGDRIGGEGVESSTGTGCGECAPVRDDGPCSGGLTNTGTGLGTD